MGIRTVNDLLKACKEQVAKGNGDKMIILSNDDEGNGGHLMFYLFTEDVENAFLYCPIEDEIEQKKYIVLG